MRTLADIDRVFPTRRQECERAGLDASSGIIPTACLKHMTDEQRDYLFPSWRQVIADMRQELDARALESKPA